MPALGTRNRLPVLRRARPGLILDGGALGEILLPNRYATPALEASPAIEVFLLRDSEDRLVATTEFPKAEVGEIAALRVVSVDARLGAFLDWGLPKDLLLPRAEQSGRLRADDWAVVIVKLDERSGRIMATMRFEKHLRTDPPPWREGSPVQVMLAAQTPLGFTAIVEGEFLGLLYHEPFAPPHRPGEKLTAYVAGLRPDGKVDLRHQATAARGVLGLTDRILDAVKAAGGKLDCDDTSEPEKIQELFGVSKRSFKQAIGALYKDRKIVLTEAGIALASASPPRPTPASGSHRSPRRPPPRR